MRVLFDQRIHDAKGGERASRQRLHLDTRAMNSHHRRLNFDAHGVRKYVNANLAEVCLLYTSRCV